MRSEQNMFFCKERRGNMGVIVIILLVFGTLVSLIGWISSREEVMPMC